jgi:hypothetical protein
MQHVSFLLVLRRIVLIILHQDSRYNARTTRPRMFLGDHIPQSKSNIISISLTTVLTISCSYIQSLERRIQELTAASSLPNRSPGVTQESSALRTTSHYGEVNSASEVHNFEAPRPPIAETPDPALVQPYKHVPSSSHVSAEEVEHIDNGSNEGEEVTDINPHTKALEFHGSTSSVAFLGRVQNEYQKQSLPLATRNAPDADTPSLVSSLHNTAFSPSSWIFPAADEALRQDRFFFRQSRKFLNGFFENLYFIHPILEREEFMIRCEDLWFGSPEKQPRSFIALYFSVLSLGALSRVWEDELSDGMGRFAWSRKLFSHARTTLGDIGSTNDIETVQCLILLAKVCQNELNPHLAYMYLGMAIRTSLSAGFNREIMIKSSVDKTQDRSEVISKTWWGLYSLEIEMSLALGRPDTLGLDDYHNRRLPADIKPETKILRVMIDMSRIMRTVALNSHRSNCTIQERLSMADQTDRELNEWVENLPENIRPALPGHPVQMKVMKLPKWSRRQQLVLFIRYLNIKMLLYRPFLVYASRDRKRPIPSGLEDAAVKCVNAAQETVDIIHETCRQHTFFRTWWYNTTYTLFAVSIILFYAAQAARSTRESLFESVEKAIEVLEAMDECVVAGNAAAIVKTTLARARELNTVPRFEASPFQNDTQLLGQYPDFSFENDIGSIALDDIQHLFYNDVSSALSGFG